ncbi:hypothetical protein CALVIDRAFT_568218 [Calocera viscosa TUFC12733]|uniref:Uncharacterized protein n=1 Tax=Calocera viscosa (strain TUFC12733) TaxID=1330018 RepID=A0A167HAC8_CALVF|nr:hypothetical protein CALVIDRAFT_568218 [Calocera viscosa TUFC12733]
MTDTDTDRHEKDTTETRRVMPVGPSNREPAVEEHNARYEDSPLFGNDVSFHDPYPAFGTQPIPTQSSAISYFPSPEPFIMDWSMPKKRENQRKHTVRLMKAGENDPPHHVPTFRVPEEPIPAGTRLDMQSVGAAHEVPPQDRSSTSVAAGHDNHDQAQATSSPATRRKRPPTISNVADLPNTTRPNRTHTDDTGSEDELPAKRQHIFGPPMVPAKSLAEGVARNRQRLDGETGITRNPASAAVSSVLQMPPRSPSLRAQPHVLSDDTLVEERNPGKARGQPEEESAMDEDDVLPAKKKQLKIGQDPLQERAAHLDATKYALERDHKKVEFLERQVYLIKIDRGLRKTDIAITALRMSGTEGRKRKNITVEDEGAEHNPTPEVLATQHDPLSITSLSSEEDPPYEATGNESAEEVVDQRIPRPKKKGRKSKATEVITAQDLRHSLPTARTPLELPQALKDWCLSSLGKTFWTVMGMQRSEPIPEPTPPTRKGSILILVPISPSP